MEMIDKGTATLCREQALPYTTVVNDTITLITDQGALAIYVYLQTKPSNWIIRAKDIQKHFGIGRDKYRSGMRFLKEIGLIECRLVRNDSGQFVDNQTILHYTPIPVSLKTRPSVEDTESLKNDLSANPTAGEPTPLVIKDNLEMKDNYKCASDAAPGLNVSRQVTIGEVLTVFEVVWGKYQNKKHKKEANTAFLKIVNKMTFPELTSFVEKVETSLDSKNKENAIGWSSTLFASYLNGECWNDEVSSTQPVKKALDMAARFPATMQQFLSQAWSRIGDMDHETQVILMYGIENGLIKKEENLDKLTRFGFMRGYDE